MEWPGEKVDRNIAIWRDRKIGKMTLAAIGEKYGLSKESVRQIEHKHKRVANIAAFDVYLEGRLSSHPAVYGVTFEYDLEDDLEDDYGDPVAMNNFQRPKCRGFFKKLKNHIDNLDGKPLLVVVDSSGEGVGG